MHICSKCFTSYVGQIVELALYLIRSIVTTSCLNLVSLMQFPETHSQRRYFEDNSVSL